MVMMAATVLPVFVWKVNSGAGLAEAQTMAFTMITMFQIFWVFGCRSERHSIFKLGFFSNAWLVYAAIISVIMQLVVVYVPAFQRAFHTVGLSLEDWALILPVSLSGFIAIEVTKIVMARRQGARPPQ